MKNKGVIYTASGEKYVKEAIYSAKSLKKFNKNIGTTLFTSDKNISSPYIDNVIFQPPIKHPQKYKIENMLKSPYDYTLYLDSDTEIRDKISELFDYLLIYDIGVTNRVKCTWDQPIQFLEYIDETCYNGGFLLFKRNEKVDVFIQAWYDKMALNNDDDIKPGTPTGDQIPLNELFFEEKLAEKLGIELVVFPNKIYNARPWLWKQAKDDGEYNDIKILHSKNLNNPKFVRIMAKLKHKFRKYASR